MNQAKIWLVVKPTVGLPLFLGSVAVIALLVHASVLTHTDWFAAYWNGSAKPPAEAAAAAVEAAPVAAPVATPEPAAAPVASPVGRLYFAVDKSDKWTEGDESLVAVIAYLKANDGTKAAISGFHDPSGNKTHNQELAKARAFVVRDALIAGGISADRVLLEKPVETTGSGDPRDARRVEVTVQP